VKRGETPGALTRERPQQKGWDIPDRGPLSLGPPRSHDCVRKREAERVCATVRACVRACERGVECGQRRTERESSVYLASGPCVRSPMYWPRACVRDKSTPYTSTLGLPAWISSPRAPRAYTHAPAGLLLNYYPGDVSAIQRRRGAASGGLTAAKNASRISIMPDPGRHRGGIGAASGRYRANMEAPPWPFYPHPRKYCELAGPLALARPSEVTRQPALSVHY
jgi:hypothetical protein